MRDGERESGEKERGRESMRLVAWGEREGELEREGESWRERVGGRESMRGRERGRAGERGR